MKHTHSYAAIGICLGIIITITTITNLIETEPSRTAIMEVKSSDGDAVTQKRIHIRKAASLTDKKLMNWLDKVVPTCFSFTLDNIDSKPLYCARKYFNRSSGTVYLNDFVGTIEDTMSRKTANFYTAVPYQPIITQPLSVKKNRLYYTVYVQTIRSVVERKITSPSYKGIWLFIAPNLRSNDEAQFMIIGAQL